MTRPELVEPDAAQDEMADIIEDRYELFVTHHAEQGDLDLTFDFMETAGASSTACAETFDRLTKDATVASCMAFVSLSPDAPLLERSKVRRIIETDSVVKNIEPLKKYILFCSAVSSIPLELSKQQEDVDERTLSSIESFLDQLPDWDRLQATLGSKKPEEFAAIATQNGFELGELVEASLQTAADTHIRVERLTNAVGLWYLMRLPGPIKKRHSVNKVLGRAGQAYMQPLMDEGETAVADIINKNRRHHAPAWRKIGDILNDPSFREDYPEQYSDLYELVLECSLREREADWYIEIADELYGEEPLTEQGHELGRAAVQTAETTQPTVSSEEYASLTEESPAAQPEDEAGNESREKYKELNDRAQELAEGHAKLIKKWAVNGKELRRSEEAFQSLWGKLVVGRKTPEGYPDIDGVSKKDARKITGILQSLKHRCQNEQITAKKEEKIQEIRDELDGICQNEDELAECRRRLRLVAHETKQPTQAQPSEGYSATIKWIKDNWPGLKGLLGEEFSGESKFPFSIAKEVFGSKQDTDEADETELASYSTQ